MKIVRKLYSTLFKFFKLLLLDTVVAKLNYFCLRLHSLHQNTYQCSPGIIHLDVISTFVAFEILPVRA